VPPNAEDNFDQKHVNNNDWKDAEAVAENSLLLRRNSVQALFKGYLYDKTSLVHRTTTVNTGKFSSMQMESLGKNEQEHDSGSTNKKLSDLISNLGNNGVEDDGGDENVIEEEEY
jgi:hypothetical protein